MFASVRNAAILNQLKIKNISSFDDAKNIKINEEKQEKQIKMFESGHRDSYQAGGTFGFSKKDLKISEGLTESLESANAPQHPWKSVQVTKLNLSSVCESKHVYGLRQNENQNIANYIGN